MTILYNRALVLAKIESAFDTDANPVAATDAFLVMDPQFQPDITLLERANVRPGLSNEAPIAGRKLGKITFGHEVRNNGNLDGSVPPMLGRLLRACAMSEAAVTTAAGTLVSGGAGAEGNVGNLAFAVSTEYEQPARRRLTVAVTTAGATPKVSITAPAEADLPAISMTDIAITTATEIDVMDEEGGLVVGLTPTFTGTLTVADSFILELAPVGFYYRPVSSQMASITLYLYLPDQDTGDALLHKLTGCRGTFSVDGTSGDFGKFSFTFTGSYVDPVDVDYPEETAVYETQKPAQVELTMLKLLKDGVSEAELCASKFTIDIANEVTPRECMNEANGYAGSIVVSRKPVMGMDPEAVLEGTHPFWENLSKAVTLNWEVRIGTDKGNTVLFSAPAVTTSGLGYQNRNSIRAYDFKGSLSAGSALGDDELVIGFV